MSSIIVFVFCKWSTGVIPLLSTSDVPLLIPLNSSAKIGFKRLLKWSDVALFLSYNWYPGRNKPVTRSLALQEWKCWWGLRESSGIACHADMATEWERKHRIGRSFWWQIWREKGKNCKAALLGKVQGNLSFHWRAGGDRLGQGRVESLKVQEAVVGWMKENRGLPSAETGGAQSASEHRCMVTMAISPPLLLNFTLHINSPNIDKVSWCVQCKQSISVF